MIDPVKDKYPKGGYSTMNPWASQADVARLVKFQFDGRTRRCSLQIAQSTTFVVVTKVSEKLLSKTEAILLAADPF